MPRYSALTRLTESAMETTAVRQQMAVIAATMAREDALLEQEAEAAEYFNAT